MLIPIALGHHHNHNHHQPAKQSSIKADRVTLTGSVAQPDLVGKH